jgi:rhodanese-related sulfurtransferase
MNAFPWLATATIVALVLWMIVKKQNSDAQISADGVREQIRAGAQIVDVRTVDEFRMGAYPRAVNIPLADLNARLAEIPKDKPVIVYCHSGRRSAAAAVQLKQAGYRKIINAGGLADMPD